MVFKSEILGRLFREPLVHFLAIGIAVFAAHRFLAPTPVVTDRSLIEVTSDQEERLAAQFEAVWRRAPTETELASLVDDHVREEIYYREALALGLDRDDTVIRRRLRQKMEFLLDAGAESAAPDEAELRAHFAQHVDRFTPRAKVTFRQLLLDGADPQVAVAQLANGADPAEFGRPTLLPARMESATEQAVNGAFGTGFFAGVAQLPQGKWSGPVSSAYGEHLIQLIELMPAVAPPFEAVRQAIEADWRRSEADELREAQYQALRERYDVILPADVAP